MEEAIRFVDSVFFASLVKSSYTLILMHYSTLDSTLARLNIIFEGQYGITVLLESASGVLLNKCITSSVHWTIRGRSHNMSATEGEDCQTVCHRK